MGSLEAAGNARRVALQARRAARGRARAQTGVARARRDSARSSAAVRDVRRGTAVACFRGQGRTASIGDERAHARTIGRRQSCRASGGSKPGPYRLASSRARATKCAGPSPRMNCSAPPVQAGKPMPKIEPMLPSASLGSPPACRQRAAFRFGADQHGRGAVDDAGGVARRVHVLDVLKRRVVAQRHRVEAERPELGERRLERRRRGTCRLRLDELVARQAGERRHRLDLVQRTVAFASAARRAQRCEEHRFGHGTTSPAG